MHVQQNAHRYRGHMISARAGAFSHPDQVQNTRGVQTKIYSESDFSEE